ncbi:sensor histidine kinase [Pseudodesulfovibrio sediminis]|uniref:histidine kinase n=1 Tax=Pseudodesulfovibrio sediminis TaxID=2810563 RepID=A0ABM7P573_9BACT|nr:ATP-binding protein [Pseudodesulfovibrio sediminis]BCS88064.1 hypothetical protein PSDVSF_13060 [Pseudodesulfovibrio sediminis]
MKTDDCQSKIDELNIEIDQLLYAISHDLRAPLRAIDGFSQAVVEDYGDQLDATGREYLERVRSGGRKVHEYIDGLLLISRESRGEMALGEVDFTRLVREVEGVVSTRYDNHVPRFNVEEDIMVVADLRLLRLLLEKLLDNAWKFTSRVQDAAIEVGQMDRAGDQVLYVRDNGVGFDMNYAEKRLFGAFQRMHDDEEYAGLGVGLATAKRIINRHGGRIWAESVQHAGTTVFFFLGQV